MQLIGFVQWASIVIAIFVFVLYKYFTRHFNYWKKRNVPYIKPTAFVGNFRDVVFLKKNLIEWMRDMYDKSKEDFFGIFVFDQPFLVIKSPKLVKHILIKDFNYFKDRAAYAPEHDIISKNILFLQKNPEWKSARTSLTPAFTSGKLKNMFPLIENISQELVNYINSKHVGKLAESKEISAKFTTDVIAKCAFGIDANSLKNENAEFRNVGRNIFEFSTSRAVNQMSHFFFPSIVDIFGLSFIGNENVSFMRDVFNQVIEQREKSNVKGNDLIDLLLQVKTKGIESLKGEKLLSAPVQFFIAGFETTSGSIGFTLYELCMNPKVQSKLREEVLSTISKHGGNITFDAVNEMKYLDMCVKESLRKYPVLAFLDRRCDENYKLPGTNYVIEKGVPVYIPVAGLHFDETLFPNPEKYDPERFRDMNEINQSDMLFYLPFGDGPRNCIGARFGKLVTMIAVASLVANFTIDAAKETPKKLQLEPRSFVPQSKVGLPLIFNKIK